MGLLDKLNPYMLYAKLAAVALIAVALFSGGWIVRGWKEDAERVAEKEAVVAEYDKRITEYKDELAASEKRAGDYLARWSAQARKDEAANAKLREEIRNANLNTVTPRPGESARTDQPFNREFVRLYNVPIRTVNGTGGGEANPGSPPGGDTTAARVDRKDLLSVHEHNIGKCLVWKRQLDDILKWDLETFGSK